MWPRLSIKDLDELYIPFEPAAFNETGMQGFVFFDAGSVLVDLEWDSFYESIKAIASLSERFCATRFAECSQARRLMSRWGRGELGPFRFAQEFFASLGSVEMADADTAALFLELKKSHNQIIGAARPGVLELVQRLKQSGYGAGILSNSTPWHETVLDQRIPFEQFDLVIFSQDVGCEKPDRRIFEIAEQSVAGFCRARSLPEIVKQQFYFIDDTPENVRAAQERGWNAALAPLVCDELVRRAKAGHIAAEEFSRCSTQRQHLVFGQFAAARVEEILRPLMR